MKIVRYLLLLLLVGYLLTGVAEIRLEERAVIKRFGRIVAKPGPGLWIGLPIGIDRIERIPIAAVRRIHVGYQPETDDSSSILAGQLLTGDQNLVNILIAVDYAVAEGDQALEDFVMHRDRVDGVISREVEALLGEWISRRSVDEVLLTGNGELPLFVVKEVRKRMEDYRLGIRVQQASVIALAPLDEVRSAFEEVNRAQTNIQSKEYRARQEVEQRLQAAGAEKYRLEQEAKSYANNKRTQAVAEVDSFTKRLVSYQLLQSKNPDILTAIWWDEMGKMLLTFKGKGRIDLLDTYLGADGLDITQIIPPAKRR